MKNVYMIGGTMGVGKTATCKLLKYKLDCAVFLDGDWCWDANPFQVTDETKKMVISNICYLLNNFIHCSAYRNIIFCWVMHEQGIIDSILSCLDMQKCHLKEISLVCNTEALVKRLRYDVEMGKRQVDIIERSIENIPLYDRLSTIKIDVSNMTAMETADKIAVL